MCVVLKYDIVTRSIGRGKECGMGEHITDASTDREEVFGNDLHSLRC